MRWLQPMAESNRRSALRNLCRCLCRYTRFWLQNLISGISGQWMATRTVWGGVGTNISLLSARVFFSCDWRLLGIPGVRGRLWWGFPAESSCVSVCMRQSEANGPSSLQTWQCADQLEHLGSIHVTEGKFRGHVWLAFDFLQTRRKSVPWICVCVNMYSQGCMYFCAYYYSYSLNKWCNTSCLQRAHLLQGPPITKNKSPRIASERVERIARRRLLSFCLQACSQWNSSFLPLQILICDEPAQAKS
jgi:hypothetical protein